ncbi:MAG: hypothetical protein AB8H03_09215 [Saprospiraceae bacterium]
MKNLIPLFLVLICSNLGFTQENSNPSPEIFIQANFAYSYIDDFTVPIAYGVGTEAKINDRFSIGGTFNYGTSNLYRRTFIDPNIKFYPKKVFKGFFLTTGASYTQLKSKNELIPLGYPFDDDRGSEVSFFSLNAGLGISTLVKNKWSIALSVSLAASLDGDLDETMVKSNFTVGYGF